MTDLTIPTTVEPGTSNTWWLAEDGQIRGFMKAWDASGTVYSTAGEPPPAGTELTPEGIASIFRQRLQDMKQEHEERQVANETAHGERVASRAERVQELVGYGLPEQAAEALVAEIPTFTPQVFAPPAGYEQALHSYGLSDEQISRVVYGWI